MKFLTIFLSTAFIFSQIVVSRPSSRLSQRIASRTTSRRSNPKQAPLSGVRSNVSHVEYSQNWAGAVLENPPSGETFTFVIGTFTVPKISSGSNSGGGAAAASAWVGIDGDTAQNSILQAGVDFEIDDDSGEVSYTAWTEWFPDYAYDVNGFEISAEDSITVSVEASSPTTGTVVLENNTKGTSKTIRLRAPDSSSALQGLNAEWIVEDFEENGSLVQFADFGTVTFTDASASTASQSVGPSGATLMDIEQNGQVLTDVSVENSSCVKISYVGDE